LTAGIFLKSFPVWLAMLALAILNGILREAVLVPVLGAVTGLLLSGVLLSALIIAVSYAALPWLGVRRLAQLLAIGLGWLTLTLVFEFSFGLWQGKSRSELLEVYTFKGGNLWPLVLVVTALAPYIAARLRRWI
jgi:hypothetical protein